MSNGRSTTLSGGHQRTGTMPGGLLPGPRLPFSVTFVRRLDTPFPLAVDRFDEWWRVASWRDMIEVAGSRLIGPPGLGDDGDERRLSVILGRGTVQAPVPMDLHVTQWSASFGTTLELLPRRRLHARHGYFREGHLVLDRVVAALTA